MFSLKIDRFDKVIIFVTFLNKFLTCLAIAYINPSCAHRAFCGYFDKTSQLTSTRTFPDLTCLETQMIIIRNRFTLKRLDVDQNRQVRK